MIKPKVLQKGDLIAIAAPAGPFDRREFLICVKKLQGLGFKVTFRRDIFSKDRYLAGSDNRRAEELNQFFADASVKAIFFARGGYGTQRILHLLDIETIKENPKVVLGYSDITALHIWLYHHGIGGTFYGPTVTRHFKLAPKKTIDLIFDTITSTIPLGRLASSGARVLKEGSAEGILVGGCISIITSSIGTPYELLADGSILFLEDVGENVYKYDRMLTHLKASGRLRGVRGIIFGTLGLPQQANAKWLNGSKNPSSGENSRWLHEMLADVLADFPGPIIYNFPCGHLPLEKLFVTMPLGVRVRLATNPLALKILEPALL